jgi:predicted RND superfamily exporter protein
VSRTLSLVDTVRVMNRVMSRDDPEAERIPETRGAVAELIFMAPKGDLDRYTNVNHSRANVLVRTGAVGSAAVRSVAAQLETAISKSALPEGIAASVTGNAILLSRSADGIARSQPRTVCQAALAIFVLVTVTFRSLRLGAVAMVPNLVPVVIFFGALGLGAAPLSLPTSLIGSVALGIAVDDTVHFLVRYGRERRRGLSPEQAALLSARRVGRAIAITSLMLMAGFLVVGLSSFATLRQFGILSAATMGVCLLTDLVLLPALLVRTRS